MVQINRIILKGMQEIQNEMYQERIKNDLWFDSDTFYDLIKSMNALEKDIENMALDTKQQITAHIQTECLKSWW